jgi:hypothetical protein
MWPPTRARPDTRSGPAKSAGRVTSADIFKRTYAKKTCAMGYQECMRKNTRYDIPRFLLRTFCFLARQADFEGGAFV